MEDLTSKKEGIRKEVNPFHFIILFVLFLFIFNIDYTTLLIQYDVEMSRQTLLI